MSLGGANGYTATSVYGTTPQAPQIVANPTQPIAYAPGDASNTVRELFNPNNPLFWFGAVLAVTLGLASFSGSGRLGPVKASGSVG